MSSASTRDVAYEAFLASSDLATWTSSLDAFGEILDGARDPREERPVDVRRALTIAVYVAWLGLRHGDARVAEQANRRIGALDARVARAPLPAGGESIMIQAVVAAAKGYHATARRMLEARSGALPVEIALLTTPQRMAAQAAALKPYVLDSVGAPFLPAVHFFGSALLDLGYQSDAAALVERHRDARGSPLMIDLRGQLLELAGSWEAARNEYALSTWAPHAYRRTVCDLILGEPVDRLSEWPEDAVEKFIAGMMDFSGETDRAGVVRSASFVRACRWSGFDNWLVHFQLGRLGFQRRRHAEAERHLATAARSAPAPFRFPVLSLRFTNLTWLGDAMDIDLTPEALEAGHAALQAPATGFEKASIRTWMGGFADGADLLAALSTSGDDFEIGRAHSLRSNVPDAIAFWCSHIGKASTPRAFFALLRVFAPWGFEKTACRFAEIVALESHDSFFPMLELAQALSGVLAKEPSGQLLAGPLADQLARVEARLEELVESEFQNAIRAFHHFLQQRRLAPARRMLLRAEQLAEGPEESLLLAIARRKAGGEGDPVALEALRRAELQSDDRLERLLIARELVAHGQLSRARAILTAEGAFSSALDLTPIEYVLALQCAALCVAEPERRILERAAVATFERDAGAGRFLRHGQRFLDRLAVTLERKTLDITLPAAQETSIVPVSSWKELLSELGRLHGERREEQELRLLTSKVAALAETAAPFSRFALWGLHRDRFDTAIRAIDRLRPTVADDQSPIARDVSPVRPRAKSLARMWRQYLCSSNASEAEYLLAAIRGFVDEERQLAERWDRRRAAEATAPLSLARGYATQGATLLEDIRSDVENADPWPSFLGVGSAIAADAKELADGLARSVESLQERVKV